MPGVPNLATEFSSGRLHPCRGQPSHAPFDQHQEYLQVSESESACTRLSSIGAPSAGTRPFTIGTWPASALKVPPMNGKRFTVHLLAHLTVDRS